MRDVALIVLSTLAVFAVLAAEFRKMSSTEKVAMQLATASAAEQHQTSNAVLTRAVAHDIRNLLASISN